MLSKSAEKLINSLRIKKQRHVERKYIAEGHKIAQEYLHGTATILEIFATEQWIIHNRNLLSGKPEINVNHCTSLEIKKVSTLTTPSDVLMICEIQDVIAVQPTGNEVVLALDDIQDPGNMGTIIRTADWMGVTNIICNMGCVDVYNSKVVQAAMGSLMRVRICETNLKEYLATFKPVTYAGALEGMSVFTARFNKPCVLIIGNEGSGINPEILPLITEKVTIPSRGSAESLNAAIAAGILLSFLTLKS